jgi:hypothetical protein
VSPQDYLQSSRSILNRLQKVREQFEALVEPDRAPVRTNAVQQLLNRQRALVEELTSLEEAFWNV